VVNGRVARDKTLVNPALGPHWGLYAEPNQLYANDGKGGFLDVSKRNPAFCGVTNVARGLACGDFNGDGALDLLVTTAGGRARLYYNTAPERGHWLSIRCMLSEHPREAYGAEVTVEAGRKRWVRPYNPAESYLCSSAPVAHFGLGSVQSVDHVQVIWPDGTCERFRGGRVDRHLDLRQGEGTFVDRR